MGEFILRLSLALGNVYPREREPDETLYQDAEYPLCGGELSGCLCVPCMSRAPHPPLLSSKSYDIPGYTTTRCDSLG
jgi:hypothetical protein